MKQAICNLRRSLRAPHRSQQPAMVIDQLSGVFGGPVEKLKVGHPLGGLCHTPHHVAHNHRGETEGWLIQQQNIGA